MDDTVNITIDKETWEKAWKSEEEFIKFVEDLTIEIVIKSGYAKDEQEAIRILGYNRTTD